jgi:vanillate monooxygenase ferredoxin subunit
MRDQSSTLHCLVAESPFAVTVTGKREIAADILSFDLRPAQREEVPGFSPGAHIELQIAPGLVRRYSVTNAPRDRHVIRIAVKLEPGSRGGSRELHTGITVGASMVVLSIGNHFPLSSEATRHRLLAAGIGITPIWSMAQALADSGGLFSIDYFFRSKAHAAFYSALRSAPFAGVSALHPGLNSDEVAEELGRTLAAPAEGEHLYVCGPSAFIEQAVAIAGQRWRATSIHTESFTAASAAVSAREFDVRLVRSGQTFRVPPDRSILEVLEAHGVPVAASCRQGTCGTCLTPVVKGNVEHLDRVLTPAARDATGLMALCVSRCTGAELELDL